MIMPTVVKTSDFRPAPPPPAPGCWPALSHEDDYDPKTGELVIAPKTAMPKSRPEGGPQQIWLASCIPAPPVEPPPVSLRDSRDAEGFRDPLVSLRDICAQWKMPEPCPPEPEYFECENEADSEDSDDDPPALPTAFELNAVEPLEINTVHVQD